MIVNNGKNYYLYKKSGLYFVCRKKFIVDEDGRGVHHIPVDNDLDEPDPIQVENVYLNQQRCNCLISGMILETMPEEAVVSWEELWNELC